MPAIPVQFLPELYCIKQPQMPTIDHMNSISARNIPDESAAVRAAADYLKLLGERVRNARARHGMTRRMLAQDSGVSERYLAQLEAGHGNFSIMLLKRVAAALDVRITDLVSEESASVEYQLAAERLRSLSPAQLAEASAMIADRFGIGATRSERVALIGMRGAGKSTLGAMLAKRLRWDFVELSREIEREAGLAVNEIFALSGQAGYRRYERRATERLLRTRKHIVIAAGGGLVAELGTFGQVLEACYTIWLRAAPEDHWERVVRRAGDDRVRGGDDDPHAMADMRRILSQREALYRKADATLDTSGRTPAQSLHELLSLVRAACIGAHRAVS
jgi:XRE family transcriptional regulator, aerobic/anaerobic benzoate catabolism transcriptional regulator